MKIGMLSGLWFLASAASIFESLQHVASLGFHHVDLHGVFHAGPAHLTQRERIAVKTELDALGLKPRNYVLHALHNIASANDAELEQNYEYLCEGIDLASIWGVNQIMLNAGQWDNRLTYKQAWVKAVLFLQRICNYAKPRGVYIAQEPEPYVWFLVNNIASARNLMEDVNRDNFKILIDLGHMALARESPEELYSLGDSIIHAHFSDHQSYLHTNQVIGTGFTRTLDYLEAFHRMGIDSLVHRYGYDDFVISFELGALGDSIEDPDAWVRQSITHLQRVAPNLKLT